MTTPERPTIGRLVHFYRPQHTALLPLGDPMPAVVTRTFGDGDGMFVAIECFGEDEKVIHRGVPFSPIPKPGCWTWPPR